MLELEIEIRDYMLGQPAIKIVMDEDMEDGEILDAYREFTYGHVELTDTGKLKSVMIDVDEIMEHNDISLEEFEDLEQQDLVEIAEGLLEEFTTSKLKFVGVKQWLGDTYTFIFEQFDNVLNLPIPYSGAQVELTKQGFLISATINQGYYQLTYPEVEIDAEKAKQILRNEMLLKPEIEKIDDRLQVVYVPINPQLAVRVDGQLIDTQTLEEPVEQLQNNTFEAVHIEKSLTELLGIDDSMVFEETEDTKMWKRPENEAEFVRIQERSESELVFESTTAWKHLSEELPIPTLESHAKQFLELVLGNVHEKFVLEEQIIEDELTDEELAYFEALEEANLLDEDEEEEEFEFEPFRTFSFIRLIDGIEADEYNIHVDVGIFTGHIKDCVVSKINAEEMEGFTTEPVLSLRVANAMYVDFCELKLARAIESNEDFPIYTLAYEICFKDGRAILEKIDGQTGAMIFEDRYE